MGCMRVFAVLAALHGMGCTLLFDEEQYLPGEGGAGGAGGTAGAGGGVGVCDDLMCVSSPLPVFLATQPEGGGAQAKVDAVRSGGVEVSLKKQGPGAGTQECSIAWDGESVFIGCLVTVDAFYLLVELEGDMGFAAHLITANDAFTTSCTGFDCTGAVQSGTGLQDGIESEVEDNAVLLIVPASSLWSQSESEPPPFELALEIGSTEDPPLAPAVYPQTPDGHETANAHDCSEPPTCQLP